MKNAENVPDHNSCFLNENFWFGQEGDGIHVQTPPFM